MAGDPFTVLVWSDEGIIVKHVEGESVDASIAGCELAGDGAEYAVLPGHITPEIISVGAQPIEETT